MKAKIIKTISISLILGLASILFLNGCNTVNGTVTGAKQDIKTLTGPTKTHNKNQSAQKTTTTKTTATTNNTSNMYQQNQTNTLGNSNMYQQNQMNTPGNSNLTPSSSIQNSY